MATTITVSERTRKRLADYKRGDQTLDDVINDLMDKVPLEDVAAEQVAEAYRRLGDGGKMLTADEFRAYLQRRIRALEKRGRK